MPKKYDLIVVGAGSGLNVATAAADQLSWHVAVVEEGPMGGTCLNRGCIPSKMIIHAADVAETIRAAQKFGIQAKIEKIDFAAVTTRASKTVDHDAAEIEVNLRKHPKITLYKTRGEFLEPKVIKVGNTTITAPRIVIAAGARPVVPPIPGLDKTDYITSDEALRLTKQPKSMIIIGGGYISAELGHFYGALGTDITIVQRSSTLIGNEDNEISKEFTRLFSQKYQVLLNHNVAKVEKEKRGKIKVFLEEKNGKTKTISADTLLVTTGRQPNSDLLKLENTHVETDSRGYIQTDRYMGTTEENVWALGDIVGKAPFKHGANMEAECVFTNMTKRAKRAVDYSIMPHAIFSSPQVAGVGITEQEAKEKNIPYEVRKYYYRDTGMGAALAEDDGFVKFIVDPAKEKILGCHILGPDAATLIHEVVVAMTAGGASTLAIARTIHIHPALSEVVQRASSYPLGSITLPQEK